MKDKVFVVLVAFVIMGIALPISAQQCGDINASGAVNIADMTMMIDYVLGFGPTPPALAMGDVDNRANVTIADMIRLAEGFFVFGDYEQLTCSPNDVYTYTSSPDDTLFIPRFLNVPADQEVVTVPFFTNLREDTKGIVFYLYYGDVSDEGLFQLTYLEGSRLSHDGFATHHDDSIMAGMYNLHVGDSVSGLQQAAVATFQRINPGVGDIDFTLIDRNALLRTGVVKDGYDIQIPTIVTIDFTDNVLQAAPLSLQFESVFGFPPTGLVQNIELSDISAPISWTAEVDQTWLQIDQTYGMTPSTIQVSVDPTGLNSGVYNGTITISDVSFQYSTPIDIPVTLTVRAPFPSMDANCDGKFNISDLTYIIDYLFGNPHGPAPCDPCTGTFPEE